MRKIKVRVWDIKKQSFDTCVSISCGGEAFNHYDRRLYGLDRFLISQYTGLKDKNGQEIYEGDIVKIPYQTDDIDFIVRKVYWDDRNAKFSTEDMIADDSDDILAKGIEIIGNIYENPELLSNHPTSEV